MSILNKFQLVKKLDKLCSCPVIFGQQHFNSKRFYSAEATEEEKETPVKKERVFFKEQQVIDGFKVFDVYMNKKKQQFQERKRTYTKKEIDNYARYNKMSIDQDWTSVWPTAAMFKQNAVPLPVRQGYVKNNAENNGLPPAKYANTELMKIPNFLHLTPPHIKKQCQAIKKFCTKWPAELKTDQDCERYFPLEITKSTYIYDGPSIRDDRARIVKLEIKVGSLDLDERSSDKLKKLAQHRYDPKTDLLTIVADRCPFRRQNEEYAKYLLTTLFFESKQIEDWESAITEEDRSRFVWEESKSKLNIIESLKKIEKQESLDEAALFKLDHVKNYKQNLTKIFDSGESSENIDSYKNSVLDILKLNKKVAI